jgi:hypothetical protein
MPYRGSNAQVCGTKRMSTARGVHTTPQLAETVVAPYPSNGSFEKCGLPTRAADLPFLEQFLRHLT